MFESTAETGDFPLGWAKEGRIVGFHSDSKILQNRIMLLEKHLLQQTYSFTHTFNAL